MYGSKIFLQFLHQLYRPTDIIIAAIRIPRISIMIDNFIIKFIDSDDYHALVTYYQNEILNKGNTLRSFPLYRHRVRKVTNIKILIPPRPSTQSHITHSMLNQLLDQAAVSFESVHK